MSGDFGWPSLSNAIQVIGLLVVIWQLRIANKQREMDALARIIDANRQLISLAFSQPKLLAILHDEPMRDAKLEHAFLQLWLNNFSMAHALIISSFLGRERRRNLQTGMSAFLKMAAMRKHWETEAQYYPESFKMFVNNILKEIGPSQTAQS